MWPMKNSLKDSQKYPWRLEKKKWDLLDTVEFLGSNFQNPYARLKFYSPIEFFLFVQQTQ